MIEGARWENGKISFREEFQHDHLEFSSYFVHVSLMATKTISLELDAYEKLRMAKRPGESFSELVRRSVIEDATMTAARLREYLADGGSGISSLYLDAAEEASRHDPIPEDPWA